MEDELDVARRFATLFITRDPGRMRGVIAPEITYYINGVPAPGGWKNLERWLNSLRECAPDAQTSIDDVVSDADRVAIRYSTRGTHTGPIRLPGMEIPPSGRPFTYQGAAFLTVEAGLVTSVYTVSDMLHVLACI